MIQDRQLLIGKLERPQYENIEDAINTILDRDLKDLNKDELFLMPLCSKPLQLKSFPHKFNFVPWKLNHEEVHTMLDALTTHIIEKTHGAYTHNDIYRVLKGNLKTNMHRIRTGMQISSLYKKNSITPERLFLKAERYRIVAFKAFLEHTTELAEYRSKLAHSFEGGYCRDFVSFMNVLSRLEDIKFEPALENVLKERWNNSFDTALFEMLRDPEIDFYHQHDRKESLSQSEVIHEWEEAKMKAFTQIQTLKSFLFKEIKEQGVSLFDEEKGDLLQLHFDLPDTFKNKNILELLLYINDMKNGATYQERFMAQHIVVNAFHELAIEHSPEFKASRHLATQLIPDRCFSLPTNPKAQRLLLLLEHADGTWGAKVHCVSEKLVLPKGTKVLGQEIMRYWNKHPDIWVWFSSRTKSKDSIRQKLTARGEKSNILSIQDFPDLNGASVVVPHLEDSLLEELQLDLAQNYLGVEEYRPHGNKYSLEGGEYTINDTIRSSNNKNPNSHEEYGDIKINGKRTLEGVNVGVEAQIKFLDQYVKEYKKDSKVAHNKYNKKRTLANIRHEFPAHLFKGVRKVTNIISAKYN